MGNLEKPLTWALVIILLGYLFIANLNYGEENSCTANNGFNIEFKDKEVDVKEKIIIEILEEEENLNVDSIVNKVLEDIDMEVGLDTLTEINIDLNEEEKTTEE